MNFGFRLIYVPGALMLHFIERRHEPIDTRFNEVWKLWISSKAKTQGEFYASYLYLNGLVEYVDLLVFQENWPDTN